MDYDNLDNLDNNILLDDGYDSNSEIKLEITDYKNGNKYVHTYSVPYKPTHCNEKRLICYSTINNEGCSYGSKCTYAHSIDEQIIDDERKFIYQIILDKNLMNFFSMTNPKTDDIYKNLLFLSHLCENCANNKCTGGYNCRNGVNVPSLKLCKNDLLTGECLNKLVDINVDPLLVEKIKAENLEMAYPYKGCINGHHLTTRNLVPYYKYIHQKENNKKNKYQSFRYIIDIDSLSKIFKENYDDPYKIDNIMDENDDDSDSSTDEEISNWFQNKNNIDDVNDDQN
ncbi:MAG: hypothetical protein Satyrvirus2_22 [Satyrvirus sp.]|uniref:C3H1-type domain-containing protein n=1 Tax=Satyrvirus sp. TaxID=2487771 RepID=A0A3G5AFF9_9VIRU|nr:MAG: hypothetical protein Satyrvirus2_22 [Satyrvirus sp.]